MGQRRVHGGTRCETIKMRVAIVCCFLLSSLVFCNGEGQCSEEISALCPELDPGSAVFLPDPSDCRKFCECSGGAAWSDHCADGLLYDDALHVCNWANSVDCGSRPIPDEPISESPDY